MRKRQPKGLSPETKELIHPLLVWPDIQNQWRGGQDTVSRIRQIGDSGEPFAIPNLLSYAFAPNLDVQKETRSAIRRLFEHLPLEQLPALDEALRTSWAHAEDWYGFKPSLKQLKRCDVDDPIVPALLSCHRSGYVRADAIRLLGESSSDTAIPFLMVRLVDWVEAVRRTADIQLIDKLQPQYAGMFVRSLGLVERLSDNSRFRPAYREWVKDLLKRPDCADHVNRGLNSDQLAVRRACYRLAVNNPALNRRGLLERAVLESDVVIRSWAFASGPALTVKINWMGLAASDTYAPIRQKAFDALARNQASFEELSKFLFDRHAGIRRACQALCSDRFGLAPVQVYRAALGDKSSKKTAVAARGLAESGSREDSQRLLELLNHPSARVRSAAVHALGIFAVELVKERLLDRISSDSRSVAREAASVLLLRKLASPGIIWAAAKQNPHDKVRLVVLRQMWRAGKWAQLRLYLDATTAYDAEVAECALERLVVWESQFNRTFVQPSASEPAELLDLLYKAQSRLPADLAKRIAFVIRSFAK